MKFLYRFSLLLLVFALLGASAYPVFAQPALNGPTDAAEMEAFFDGLMLAAMQNNHVPGAVIVVVKDGELFFDKGYGYANVKTQQPVDTASTLFRPGSVSKLFTWTAVMQLVESGQLSLDEDVNAYLDFELTSQFDTPVTLRHLMTHTAGFEDKALDLFKLNAEEVSSLEAYIKTNPPKLVFPPGEIAAYSNYGTALAGYIVEQVSGIPFNRYIEENIFQPLGMEHAAFQQPLPEGLIDDMALGYGYEQGQYLPGRFEYVVGSPAGALSASGLDMARFMIAHLQKGAYEDVRILETSTAETMHSLAYTADERMGGMALGFFYRVDHGQTILSHGGDTILFHSNLSLFLEEDLGIFISTNGTNGNTVVETVLDAFLDHYYPAEKAVYTTTDDFETRIPDYSGTYFLARNTFTTFEKLAGLMSGVSISVDEDAREVLVQYASDTIRYIETEPGLLLNPADPADRLSLKKIDGKVTIHPILPFVFLKNQWYENTALMGFILLAGLIMFLITIIRWGLEALRKHKDTAVPQQLKRWARLTASAFALLYLVFIFGIAGLFMDMEPVFAVPKIFFHSMGWQAMLLPLANLLPVLAAAMLVFAILAWLKSQWKLSQRIVYTMLTILAGLNLWLLYYWNLLF